MTLYIIVAALLIAAVVAFVLLKKKKGFGKKSNNVNIPQSTAEKESPIKQKATINEHLRREIENSIRHKNYQVAEAQINAALHQNESQHDLYLLLTDVHLNQKDDLALEKLITHLQEKNLYDIVDQIILRREAFKAQPEQSVSTTEIEKTSTSVSTPTQSIPEQEEDNSLNFDNLLHDSTTPSHQAETDLPDIEFSYTKATPVEENNAEFSFENTSSHTEVDTYPEPQALTEADNFSFDESQTTTVEAETDLDFSFDDVLASPEKETHTETDHFSLDESQTTTVEAEADLDFSFDDVLASPKKEETHTETDHFSLDESQTTTAEAETDLDFSFDDVLASPEKETHTETDHFSLDESQTTTAEAETDLDFSFDDVLASPEKEETHTETDHFSLDESQTTTVEAETDLDFSFDDIAQTETAPLAFDQSSDSKSNVTNTVEATEIDPLVVQFPHLKQYNEAAVNLKLAQQYIALGSYEAARTLLIHHEIFDDEQKTKADMLLEQIAS